MDPSAAPLLAAGVNPKGLSGLARRGNDPAAARAAAQQFGALLMQNLFRQADGSGLPVAGGVGGGVVNSLFADTMSRAAMSGERLGLADLMLRSIMQKQQQAGGGNAESTLAMPPAGGSGGTAQSGGATGGGFPLSPYWQANGLRPLGTAAGGRMPGAVAAAHPSPGLPLEARIAALMAAAGAVPPPAVAPGAAAPSGTSANVSPGVGPAANPAGGATPQQVADFVQRVGPLLQAAGRQLGVSPRILLAQAAIETGWGRSVVGNNLFGIKAGGSWSGDKVSAATHEYENGELVSIRDNFRAYPSFEASVQDFVALVANSRRYQAALGAGEDAGAYARALLAGGWATDINYVHKLEAVAGGRHATAAFAPGATVAPSGPAATTPL